MLKTNTKEFETSSYLSQVRRLRAFATEAMKSYPIKNYELKFIHHGENCTFKVLTKKQNYLLRIHRKDNHSRQAIKEEIKWIKHLDEKTPVDVQRPIADKRRQFVGNLTHESVGNRFFDLFSWKDGFIKYNKNEKDFFSVGSLLGELQRNAISLKHRNYWSTQGLVGNQATFGALHILKEDYPKEYKALETCRKEVLSSLKSYEQKKGAKLGLIHADLHFGNMIWNKSGISPIDFDDCGNGIQMYDLAVNFYNSSHLFKRIGKKQASLMKYSLIEGYNSISSLSQADIDIIPDLVRARDILMIPWLYSRRDNPRLRDHLEKDLKNKVKRICLKKEYKI